MTEYFEVLERDGAARLGELRLSTPVQTPAVVDEYLEDGGSLWSSTQPSPSGHPDRLTVLPHRGFPSGTRSVVQEAFAPAIDPIDQPAAAVVTAQTATDLGVDAYVLSGLAGLVGNGRRLVETIVETRRSIPPDTALYAPGIATPATVPLLCYLGIDLVDTDWAFVAGLDGRYLTTEGACDLGSMSSLPCPCPTCGDRLPDDMDAESIAAHNVACLTATVRLVRERIRSGRLRDYLEGQVRHVPWLTAAMRVLDDEWRYLEERTPIVRQAEATFTTDDALRRVEVLRFAERVTSRYRPALDAWPLVLVPCSATKPYSQSPSHRDFREAIDYRGHVVSLTSPLGVVPDELELTYPAQQYDTAVTGRWSPSERALAIDILQAYLDRAAYPRIVAHVPDEGYRAVVETAVERAGGGDVTFTVDGHPRSDESLANLADAFDGESRYRRERRYRAIVGGIAAYQFGPAGADALLDDTTVTGRYPRLRVFDHADDQLATVVPQYGFVALTLDGAYRLAALDEAPRVHIDAFVPHGSVLAPGVTDADPAIRVGDEVVVEGPAAFGVGRAAMRGREMVDSQRGIAVDVRHVEER